HERGSAPDDDRAAAGRLANDILRQLDHRSPRIHRGVLEGRRPGRYVATAGQLDRGRAQRDQQLVQERARLLVSRLDLRAGDLEPLGNLVDDPAVEEIPAEPLSQNAADRLTAGAVKA